MTTDAEITIEDRIRVGTRVWVEAEVEHVFEPDNDPYVRLSISRAYILDSRARRRLLDGSTNDVVMAIKDLVDPHHPFDVDYRGCRRKADSARAHKEMPSVD